MKRRVLAVLAVGAFSLSACGASDDAADAAVSAEAAPSATPAVEAAGDLTASAPAAGTIAPNAPAYAVLYPGATMEEPPTLASDAQGSGGLATFVTQADPEAVITFYRERAEATGLASVMAMDQGEAQAYGAAGTSGETLQVVASPTEEATTSVQLTWSAGG